MYDIMKVSYCQNTQEAKDNISKIFDREYVYVLGEDKVLIKAGNKLHTVSSTSDVALQNTKIYGVEFEGSASKGTRTYNAVGMVANAGVGAEEVVNDFDDVIKTDEVIVDIDANGNLYEKAIKGQPGYNVSDGQVYIKFYKFYWNGSFDSPAISYTQTELTYIEIPTFYIAKYRAKIDENGKLLSQKGVFPSQGSLNTFFKAAQVYNKDCVTETMPAHMAMSLLFMVEFATRDAQTIMAGFSSGCYSESYKTLDDRANTNTIKIDPNYSKEFRVGQTIVMNTSLSSSFKYGCMEITDIDLESGVITFETEDGNPVENIPKDMCVYNYAWRTGSTDDVVASSGSMGDNTSGKYDCKYRGVETPYGSQYSWICDVGSSRSGEGTEEAPYEYPMWYLKDPRKYQPNLSDEGKITEDYIKSSFNLGTTDGYIMKLGQDSREKRMCSPIQLGASSSTFYSDYYTYPRYDTMALHVGGRLARGRTCGFFCFGWFTRFGLSDWWCGARGVLLTVF